MADEDEILQAVEAASADHRKWQHLAELARANEAPDDLVRAYENMETLAESNYNTIRSLASEARIPPDQVNAMASIGDTRGLQEAEELADDLGWKSYSTMMDEAREMDEEETRRAREEMERDRREIEARERRARFTVIEGGRGDPNVDGPDDDGPDRGGGGGGGARKARRFARRLLSFVPFVGAGVALLDGMDAYAQYREMQSAIDNLRGTASPEDLDALADLANQFLGAAAGQLGAGFVPVPGVADAGELALDQLKQHLGRSFADLRNKLEALRVDDPEREALEQAADEIGVDVDELEEALEEEGPDAEELQERIDEIRRRFEEHNGVIDMYLRRMDEIENGVDDLELQMPERGQVMSQAEQEVDDPVAVLAALDMTAAEEVPGRPNIEPGERGSDGHGVA